MPLPTTNTKFMPRIYDGNSDPFDFCKRCFPKTEEAARRLYGKSEGPDGRGNCFDYNAEHPDYGDTDYSCDKCGRLLVSQDNWI
jgi:hypothetical protein